MKDLAIGLLLSLISMFCMSGCVVATRRDFNQIIKGWESVGYLRGLSDCADIARRK